MTYVAVNTDDIKTHREVNIVMKTSSFLKTLGYMSTSKIQRQLMLDVPRSVVCIDNIRCFDVRRILKTAFLPQLCTQAVLAPILEWCMNRNVFLSDSRVPLSVNMTKQEIFIQKFMEVRNEHTLEKQGGLEIQIHCNRDKVFVKMRTSKPRNRLPPPHSKYLVPCRVRDSASSE